MRIFGAFAVVCSLFGGIWLELARVAQRPPRGVAVRARAANAPSPAQPVAVIDCDKAAKLAHAPDYTLSHLGSAALLALDRVPVRSERSIATLAGWRMDISSDHGAGGITSLELPEGTCYGGDGVFSAWPAGDLARAYIQLTPDPAPIDEDLLQLD